MKYRPEQFRDKRNKWYYVIAGGAPFLAMSTHKRALPSTSAASYRRLIWGCDSMTEFTHPVLSDPFTVMVGSEVVFKLTTRKWIVIATANILKANGI